MTENEAEVLAAMIAAEDTIDGAVDRGLRPMDFGGSSNSHHAQTAIRMEPKGWVERNFGAGWGEPKPYKARGSCRYRTTLEGRSALANHRVLIRAAGT
jgi:hypothetical protein